MEHLARRVARFGRLSDDARLLELLDALPSGVIETSLDGRLTFANAAFHDFLDAKPGEVLGRPIWELARDDLHRSTFARFLRDLRHAPSGLDAHVCRLQAADGSERHLRLDFSHKHDHDDILVGYTAIVSDITQEVARDALEKRLRVITDHLPALIAYVDDQERYRFTNAAYRTSYGPGGDLIGRTIAEGLGDETYRRLRPFIARALSGEAVNFEIEIPRARDTDETRWIAADYVPDISDGKVLGFYALIRDVTDRVNAVEQIQESEQRFRAIFENASDAVVMADEASLQLVLLNPTACRWLGYTNDEWGSLTVRDIHPPESHPEVLAQFMLLSAGKIEQAEDIPVLRKDGSVFRADVSAAPVNLDGKRYLCGFFRDATARLDAERAMRLQNRQLEKANELGAERIAQQAQMIAQIHDPVIGLDLDGTISSWNAGAQRLFGYTADEMLGASFSRLFEMRDAGTELREWLARVDSNGELECESTLRRRSGHLMDGLVSLSLLRNADGEPRGYAVYCLDITQRKEAEQAMKSALESARRASEAKSTFLSRMSHELRTPMNAILGFAQLLELDGELSTAQRENVDEIRLAGRHLLGLINDILDLSRIENGRLEVKLEAVDVGDLVDEVLQMGQQMAADANVRIENSVHCPCHVRADRLRLRQILLNLVSNGIKYNRDGGLVRMHCHASRNGCVRIEVEDTGVGIAEGDRTRIFEPFERLHLKAEVEGVGIGLALSRQLIELMGGEIGVDSRDGGGSRFWVEFAQADCD